MSEVPLYLGCVAVGSIEDLEVWIAVQLQQINLSRVQGLGFRV